VTVKAPRSDRMPSGTLVVSFDVELGWGNSGRLTPKTRERLRRGRALLPQLLETVQREGSVATWAVTMALVHEGPDALSQFLAEQGAHHLWSHVSKAYPDLSDHGDAYFFPQFVRTLLRDPTQELACHGYCHTVWNGDAQAAVQLDLELKLSQVLAQTLGIRLETLVFPQNRYSEVGLDLAMNRGFVGFRGDEFVSGLRELTWPELLAGRTRRMLNAFGLGTAAASGTVRVERGLYRVPGQRFLRLEDPSWFRRVHLRRVRAELTALARRGEILHIWCHPENLASDPRAALDALGGLLALGTELRQAGLIENRTMAEVCSQRVRPL
jgi:peptidoglycan/xylan/chitin deacetylase (PgdA/CDA1 family)